MPVSRATRRFFLLGAAGLTTLLLLTFGVVTLRGRTVLDAEVIADSIGVVLDTEKLPPSLTAGEWQRVKHVYDARENRPIWMDGDGRFGRNARDLVSAIGQVDRQGLRIADYPVVALEDAVAAAAEHREPGAVARAEVLLTAAYVDLATDLLTGRLDPRRVARTWHVDSRSFDVDSAVLAALGDGRDVTRSLAGIRPVDAGYGTLVAALARYRQLDERGEWPTIPESPKLRPGVVHPAVAVVRQRLALEGYAAQPEAVRLDAFDPALAAVVAEFQARHGLPIDSAIGPATRKSLAVSAGRRADQVAANLERLRWLPPELPARRIVVNIPSYRLEAFDGGSAALSMRVVVGDELDGKNTPIFADSMQFVEFGPYWNVPAGIAIDEILPKVRANPRYLERNDYEVVAGAGEDPPVVRPASLTPEDISAGRYRIRQRPGEKNALGHVKFLFPNDFAVYLHDTPSRNLFAANARAASHGCVRVEDPAALARFVLKDQSEWTAERIDEALGAGKRERITLTRPIPVYLVYLTAYVNEGLVHFRDDIYGHDAAIVRLIDADVPNVAARDSLVRDAATRLTQRLGEK